MASPIPLDYACPSEHLTHVHWSGWSMGRNQLISVCKRLPGWILVVVPVLTMSSAASCPWVRVPGYAVVQDQPDHEAAGRISNWTKDYLHKAAVACRVSCMSRRARDDSLLNPVGASSRSPYQGDDEDDLCLRGRLGAGDELLAWCRERFAAGMPRHPAADSRVDAREARTVG